MKPAVHFTSRAICEKGIRPDNQDSIAPDINEADKSTNVYVVCDGVGGGSKGEVASRICAKTVADFLAGLDESQYDSELYYEGLRDSEALIERYIAKNPGNESMSTTLTWIRFTEKQEAHLGWVGDSRIYQFRGDKIIYQTSDHSLVNAMIKAGDLTEEEARTHPKKNVIMRAVSGVGAPAVMDMQRLTDLQSGDRFLLCTDGITDALSNDDLADIVGSELSVQDAMQSIHESCALNSKDNYSCYLVEIQLAAKEQTVNQKAAPKVEQEALASAAQQKASKKQTNNVAEAAKATKVEKAAPVATQSAARYPVAIVLAFLLGSIIASYFIYQHFENKKEEAIFESILTDGEMFYKQGEYTYAIEQLEEAERMKPLDPVMKTMLDSAYIKQHWPVYSDLVISDLSIVARAASDTDLQKKDQAKLQGFSFTCATPKRITGLHYVVHDSLSCIKTNEKIHFNVDMASPLQVDSNRVVFWTNLQSRKVEQVHYARLMIFDEKGTDTREIEFGDQLHYEKACTKTETPL